MTIRNLHSTLKNSLMDYDPFIVAHLIKFEKPQKVAQFGGTIQGVATDYTYITDAQHDILYNDGASDKGGSLLGVQNYRANKVLQIGTINENIQAKASNMSIKLDTAALGAQADSNISFTSTEITGDVDLMEAGFQEGDKIKLTRSGSSNNNKHVRIDAFKNGGKTIVYTAIDTITSIGTAQLFTISLAAEEINSILLDKESSSYTNYINREVLIYKVHINPETRAIIGEPFLYFKGITSGATINEKLDSSEITWTLSSHWGDFIRVQGRLTDDATHRALQIDGSPDLNSVLRSDYATDLGFIHSNTAVNHLATYMAKEKDYKQVDINGGWPGGKRLREIEIEVPRQTDLQFNLQAKMLPVVYGVRKIDSFPVFVDTHKDSSAELYKVDALCEGKIAGILDVYVEGNPRICLDKSDFNTRNSEGTDFDADTVEVQCAGRADRGDTLSSYSAEPTPAEIEEENAEDKQTFHWAFGKRFQKQVATKRSFFHRILFLGSRTDDPEEETDSGADNAEQVDATGIGHRGTHTMDSPITADLTFHQGLPDQHADNTLVNLAANNKFKIQNTYYPANATNPYWSPSHRLLDTAYVMGKYTIADGETSVPKFEYVVRGRDPECYNYDGSYRQETKYSSAAFTSFGLGDSVTLHETSTNTQIGSAVDIIDKWVTFDSDGVRDYRFRFSTTPTLIDGNGDPITAFYMKSGTDKWYMQTWDHTELTASPASKLSSTSFTSSAGTSHGRKYSFTSMSSHLEAAINHGSAQLGITSSSTDTMLASTFEDFDYNSSTNILDNLTHLNDDPGSNEVVVKNAIRLSSSASSVDNFYNGATITVTHNTSDGTPYIQERTVIDYIGGTSKVAIVDAPWDWQHIPDNNDTFSIGSIGDRRVTLNPSMQLLDYLTNKRYGKGLDITDDIDLEQFKEAAVKCDTRSTVSMVFSSSNSFSVGEKYQYPQSGNLQWRGTIDKIETVGNKKVVTFKDVIGKLGTKWNNYKTFASGEVYWYNGKVYLGTGSIVSTAPGAAGAQSSLTIHKVGGGTAGVDISTAAANGNPIVKKHSSVTGEFSASGYSLYDCDEIKYWKYLGWDDGSQRNVTRHQMNQVVDTKLPLFENINKMLYQFNGMLKYTAGKYGLEIKGQKGTVQPAEQISDEDIIGTIRLSDKGLKQSKNYVSTSIIDPANKFEGRSVSFFNSTYLKEDKGVQKKGQISQQGVTNYFNARFNIQQYLDESRYGLTIQFTMAPRGLLLTAGTIIELTYPRFGYSSKEFRITNLNFKKDGTVDITADEHNDNAYVVPEIGAGAGFGVVETPEVSAANVQKLPTPAPPTSLQCSQTNTGEIVLSWNNSATFSSATHLVEVYSSSVNNFSNTTDPVSLIGTSTTNIYHDPVTDGEGNKTRYYWIRYQVRTPQLNLAGSDFRNVPSNYLPATPQDGSTHTGIQGIGQAAFAVRTIDLDPGDETAFVYNNAGDGIQVGNDNNTVMSTTTHNTSGTESFKWYKKGPSDNAFVEQSGQTSSSFTFNAPSNFSDMPQTIKVELTDTLSDGTTLTAENQFTFIGLRTVEDAYTVLTTASSFNFQASEFGVIDGPGAFSTTFTVKKGGTAYTYDGTSTYDANSYRYGTITGITPSGSVVPEVAANGTVSISTSSGNFLTGTTVTQCTFDVPILDNADGSTIATSRIVLTKSLDGINARTVKLSAPEQVIAYDSAGATPDPSASFEITATPFNTTGTPYYQFFKGGSSIQASSTDNTLTYTAPSSYATLPEVITVKMREDSAVGAVLATDTFTVFGVKAATDAVDQKTVFIFSKNDGDGQVGFSTDAPYSEASPATAANQTFADPLEGLEDGWSTSQPTLGANNDVIYMSQRTFTSDGSSPQQSSWTTPVVAARRIDGTSFTVIGSVSSAATANVKFRFEKNAHPDVNPAYETGNILISGQSNTQYSVTIPSDHANIDGNDFGSFLMYVSPRDVPVNISNLVLNASSDGSSTNEPNFSDVFGGTTISSPPLGTAGAVYEHPTGTGTETWGGFANSESTLKRPTPISFSSDGSIVFEAFVPNADSNAQSTLNAAFGSASAGDAVIAQDSGNLWIYNGTQWNDVGQIKGDDGTDGINEKRVYLFAKNPTLTNGNPPAVTADAGQQTYDNPTSGVINGWTTTQGSLTANDDIIYMVQRLFTNGGTGTESSWSAPIVVAQKIDGVSPDALTVTVDDSTAGQVTLNFSDGSTATLSDGEDGTTKGVKPLYAASANPTQYSQVSLTQGTNEFVNFYEYTGTFSALSDSAVEALTFVKVKGEDGDNEGVIPVYADDANGTNKNLVRQSGQNFIKFEEWTGSPPSDASGVSGTWVEFVGEDGANAILLAYDNSSHVVPVSTSGSAVFTGSGGTLQVYDGNTELSFHQNAQSSAFPSAEHTGKFNVDITKVSGDTLTEPTNSGSGSVGAVIGDFTADPVTLTQVTKYRITAYIRALDGTTLSRHVDVSLVPADQGATGPDGLRSVSGHLYYEDTTGTAPSAPGGTTYTFNTGLVSGDDINENGTTNCWKNSNNTMSSTSTNTYYVITYQGVEAAANSSTLTVSYGTVKTHTSFDGVVTFTDGNFSLDGTTIDTIDGTNIQLGATSLSASNVLNSNTTQADVGLDQVLNHAQVRADLTDAPAGILNSSVSINADGTLSNAGSGAVTATGLGAESLELLSGTTTGSGDNADAIFIKGNRVTVLGPNTNTWNTHVYSKDGYETASVSFVPSQDDAFLMVGLNTDPAANVNFQNIDYAFYLRGEHSDSAYTSHDHKANFYVNGNSQGSLFTYAVGDKFTITYDGVKVKWFHNGTLKHEVETAVTGNLHMDSSFYGYQPSSTTLSSTSIEKISFIPVTSIKTVPKASVGLDQVSNHAQVRLDLVDAPAAIKNNQITLNNSSGTLSLNNAGSGNITLAKGDVGLGNVTDGADITADTVSGLDFIDHSTGNDTTISFKGNRIQVANAGTEWGTSAWYSKDGYNKGCMLTFTVPQDNKRIMFGLNTNPSSSTGFGDLDYAWYFRTDSGNGVADIYEGGSNVDSGNIVNPYSAGDRFTITYDGVNIRYYHNGSLERTVAATITDALHADGTGDSVSFNINNVSFMPISSNAVADAPAGVKNDQISINADGTLAGAGSGQVTADALGATNLKLLSSGGKTVTITGNKVAIGGGGTESSWETQVYSVDGYDAAQVSFVVDQTGTYAMVGINADPASSADYHHIDFAWYVENEILQVRKDGGQVSGTSNISYSAGDKLTLTYDGVNARYYQNGSLRATVAATKTGPFHFDSSWYKRERGISQVQFGPINNVSSLPAAVVGLDLVDNKSAATILSETHTGNVSGTINNVSASTVSSGALDGAQVQAQQSLLPRADDSEWSLGSVGSGFAKGIWARNGAGGDENTIVLEEGPFGTTTRVWKSISTDESSNDGGFHNNGTSQRFPIQDDVTYRFSVFIKQSDFDGSIYFGAYNYDHDTLTNGNPTNVNMFEYNGSSGTTNKYWFGNNSPSTDLPSLNEWYLWVGFINPSDTSINSGKGGLYKVSTGERVVVDNDIRFNSSADTFAVRTYLFYSSTGSGTTVRWAHPRVDRMDRSAPTIMQLLGSENAVLNREVSINADGTLNNAGSGAVTASGLGADTLTILTAADNGSNAKTITVVGNTIKAGDGTAGWNTHAYSKEGYEACAVMYQVDSGTGSYFVGLNTDPANNTSYNTIDYAIYNANGNIQVRVNGTGKWGPNGIQGSDHNWGSYSAGDAFAITYDGINFRFYHNGVQFTSITNDTITNLLHLDTSFYTINRQISRVAFKPLTSIRTVPKESVGLGNINNPSSAVTPIAVADVSPNIGGVGQSKIAGSVIRAGTTIVAGEGTNKAGLTGTAADGTIGTAANSAETDIRIFSGSTFANRANAPFRVQQDGGFRAEFGHVGGFSIGEDALISTSDQPIITLGQNLVSNPSKQITLTSRSADEYMLFAGIEVPPDGVGIKKSDNPPFGVDKDGKVDMRSFELRDDNGQVILSSTNLLSGVLLSQINSQLKAGSESVTFTQDTPNNVVRIVTTSSQTIEIDFELVSTAFRVLGMHKVGFTQTQAFDSIPDSISVEVEYRSGTSGGFSPFGTVTFTGVEGADGSNPGPSATQYWIHVEEYHARTRGDCYRSEIVAGHGCFNNAGNLVGGVSRTLSAGTYEFRINSETSSSKNITIATRDFNPPVTNSQTPTNSQATLDTGYGDILYYTNASPSDSYMITNKRIFTVSGNGPAYAVDINHTPIKITEGKTFDDFLTLTGGTITGNLRVNGDIQVNNSNTTLDQGTNTSLEINTSHGWLKIGPQNTSWSHFYTDRARYYFDKGITVDSGLVGSYNEILQLQVSGTTRCQLSSTTISAQNGAKFSGAGAIGYVDVTYNSNTDDDQVVPYSIPTGTKPIAAVVVDPNQGTAGTDGNGNGFDMATIRNLKQGSMIVNRYDIENGTPNITMRIYYTTTDT